MEMRHLGDGLDVTALGLGLMGMSGVYGAADDDESVATIRAALDEGVALFDNAEAYGGGHSEEVLGRALAGRRDEAVVTTKFGLTFRNGVMGENGSPAHVKASLEGSLRRMGMDHVDVYFQHRVDLATPIEETVGAMAELVAEGKARHIGLCEVSASTLRRAHAVHPIAAVQSEYSLWHRDPEDEVLPACDELGVGFLAYSPLGRGMLTGKVRRIEDLPPGDFRRVSPRFQGENFQRNLDLVDHVTTLAAARATEPAQLALAWILARGPGVAAIFGTRHQANLRANLGALGVSLSADELAR
ncbi:MAG: aldo/keto reductase, partial [Acidimicrobiales bacterium]